MCFKNNKIKCKLTPDTPCFSNYLDIVNTVTRQSFLLMYTGEKRFNHMRFVYEFDMFNIITLNIDDTKKTFYRYVIWKYRSKTILCFVLFVCLI